MLKNFYPTKTLEYLGKQAETLVHQGKKYFEDEKTVYICTSNEKQNSR